MITLELGATYDGMDVVETWKEVDKLRSFMSDEEINELLEKHKDKQDSDKE